MFHRAVSILLAGYIVACPLLCRANILCCVEDSAREAVATCCDSCRGSESRGDQESAPSEPSSPSPGECGGCICGGAVIEVSAFEYVVLDGFNLIAIPLVDTVASVVAVVQRTTTSWAILPDDDMNLGRAMRCRMMSYLC